MLAVGAGGVVWTFLLSSIFSLYSPSLWETARYRLNYCLKGPLNAKQPTKQVPEDNDHKIHIHTRIGVQGKLVEPAVCFMTYRLVKN